jgi:hypothetical protein
MTLDPAIARSPQARQGKFKQGKASCLALLVGSRL